MAKGGAIRSLSGIASAMTQLQQRLYQAPPDNISGLSPQAWPAATQPVQPIGPEGASPLAWSFWQGQNQTYTPRPDAEYTAHELRELAMYPLARILIDQVKDMICSLNWKIQLRHKAGETNAQRQEREANDPIIKKLTQFFEYPDGQTTWGTWIRPWINDVLTIDAGAILLRRTFNGEVAQLWWVPGNDITRYIDDNGFTPQPPSPAYAQLWEGIPRVNLTTDQLVYQPYNIVPRSTASSHLYGCSPVEAMATEIKIGIERLRYVLAFYNDGSTPGIVQIVPSMTIPDKITETMAAMNSDLAGDLAKRRQWRLVQGFTEDGKDQIIQLKEPVLADAFDDLHIRKLAYGFGASPQRLLKMMNRAASESNQDAAEEEGTYPWVKYVKSIHDLIIQRKMGYADYEWVPDTNKELDPQKQSAIDKSDVDSGIRSRNEARLARGLDPDSAPEADILMITTPQGPVPLDGAVDRTQQTLDNATTAANKPAPQPLGSPKTEASSQSSEKKTLKSSASTQEATSSIVIDPSDLTPKTKRFIGDLEHRLNRWCQTQSNRIAAALEEKYTNATKMVKADDSNDNPDNEDDQDDLQPELLLGGMELPPLERHTIRALALLMWRSVDWRGLSLELEPYLEAVALEGIDRGMSQFSSELTAQESKEVRENAEAQARQYAEDRAAEVISMRRNADGNLVPNPSAHWPLTDVMRRDFVATAKQAVEENWTANQFRAVIDAMYALSPERMEIVANAELPQAQSSGTYIVWVESGVVTLVRWRTSDDPARNTDECDECEDQGIVPLGHEFFPGVKCPLLHPHCACYLQHVPNSDV